MKNVSVRLPKLLLMEIEEELKKGMFRSRSELIREAVRVYLRSLKEVERKLESKMG